MRHRAVSADRHGFEMFEKRRPVVPGQCVAARDHVISRERADRDARRAEAELLCQRVKIFLQLQKNFLAVIHEVHLVDRHENIRNSKQRRDVRVPPRLRQNALRRVDQNHREIRGRSAGGHVARVLLVARRIRDDEFPARRFKIAVGDVDGDALLALGAQAVGEQRKIHRARRAIDAAVFYRGELVLEDRIWNRAAAGR